MAGQPTKPGNWGNWATIHSESTDKAERERNDLSAPPNHPFAILPGRECEYSRNVSDQLILCQNDHSPYAGRMCPGECPLFVKKAETSACALITDEPNRMCAHVVISEDTCRCGYYHDETVECKYCKAPLSHRNYRKRLALKEERLRQKTKPHEADQLTRINDITRVLMLREFYPRTSPLCHFDQFKLKCRTGKLVVNMPHEGIKQIRYYVCPRCGRLFITTDVAAFIRECGIPIKVIEG